MIRGRCVLCGHPVLATDIESASDSLNLHIEVAHPERADPAPLHPEARAKWAETVKAERRLA